LPAADNSTNLSSAYLIKPAILGFNLIWGSHT
jgi:hypothetical protein